jgi:adenylate cyclase
MISKYSIAVLPFSDTSPDKDTGFLSDGMTLEMIHALSRYQDLQVTSRYSSSRFSAAQREIGIIRSKLRVAWLVDGNIQLSGDAVSVTAQLIRTEDGSIAGSFNERAEFRDILRLQENMAASIAAKIKTSMAVVEKDFPRSVRSEAMEEYMKGQYLLNQLESGNWQRMMTHFERSLELEPDFNRPMVAICHSYAWLASIGAVDPEKARREIDGFIKRLFSQNHQISDVYQLQAEKYFWIDWKPMQALEQIMTSLELNQSNSAALVMKGLILAAMGRIEESLDALFHAEKLDPYGENVKYCIGLIYRYTGDYDMAYRYIEESLEISPSWLAPYFTMMEVLCVQKRFDEIRQFIGSSREVPGFAEMIPVFQGMEAAYRGKVREALGPVEHMAGSSKQEAVIAPLYYYFGLICLQLGRKDEAFQWIRKGLQFRSTPFLFLHIDNAWDPLREDPRFDEIVQSSNLPHPDPASSHKLKYRKSRLDPSVVKSLQGGLEKVLEEQQAFLDPALSLTDLAELCDASVNQLSQYLNGHLGKSFYDFINRFRLEHFLKIAVKKEWENLSILGLAYESGFNSKTTFNTFFKRELQITPREFLKRTNEDHTGK